MCVCVDRKSREGHRGPVAPQIIDTGPQEEAAACEASKVGIFTSFLKEFYFPQQNSGI